MRPPLSFVVTLVGFVALDSLGLIGGHRDVSAAPPPPPISFTVTPNGVTDWVVNGANDPTLTLNRGSSYDFNVTAPGHLFYIKTAPEVGSGSQWTQGVKNNGTSSGTVSFGVPASAPDLLYYQCGIHPGMSGRLVIVAPVAVEGTIPAMAWLGRAVPNPVRTRATFRLGLPRDARIDVSVFDARGHKIRNLWRGSMTAGEHSITWDGRDEDRRSVPSGAYFYSLRVEGQTMTGRLSVAR